MCDVLFHALSSAVDKHMFTTTKIVTVATQLNFTALASAPGYAFKDHEKKVRDAIFQHFIQISLFYFYF